LTICIEKVLKSTETFISGQFTVFESIALHDLQGETATQYV